MKLIDKDALVAEIESKIEKYTKHGEESDAKRDGYGMYWGGVISCLNEVQTLIDTLEVKEVNLEKELKEDWLFADKSEVDCFESMCLTKDMFVSLAKKYFKLGLQARADQKLVEKVLELMGFTAHKMK